MIDKSDWLRCTRCGMQYQPQMSVDGLVPPHGSPGPAPGLTGCPGAGKAPRGQTVRAAFARIAKQVFTADQPVDPVQIEEARKFFYAGAAETLNEVVDALSRDDDPEADGAYDHVMTMREECAEFGRSLLNYETAPGDDDADS